MSRDQTYVLRQRNTSSSTNQARKFHPVVDSDVFWTPFKHRPETALSCRLLHWFICDKRSHQILLSKYKRKHLPQNWSWSLLFVFEQRLLKKTRVFIADIIFVVKHLKLHFTSVCQCPTRNNEEIVMSTGSYKIQPISRNFDVFFFFFFLPMILTFLTLNTEVPRASKENMKPNC